jgi:hypothetical protein
VSGRARPDTASPRGAPLNVDGAARTRGSRRSRFTFAAEWKVKKTSRSPTAAIITGVETGVESRR